MQGSKMKIIHTVENYYPSVGGAQEVVRQISEHLAARGHDVTVVTSTYPNRAEEHRGVKIRSFPLSGNKVRGIRGPQAEYLKFLKNSNADIILNYAAQQWTTDSILDSLSEVPGKKVFLPCGFSGLHWAEYKTYYEKMESWIKAYDAIVLINEQYRDSQFVRAHANGQMIRLIPNGADEHEFIHPVEYKKTARKLLGLGDKFVFLSIGSHTGIKGHSEAIEFFNRQPLKNSELIIIGNSFDKDTGCWKSCHRSAIKSHFKLSNWRNKKRIRVLNLNRSETLNYLYAADLFLFFSNIECSPLVLFESSAAGTPFLSADVGNTREISAWLGGGWIANTQIDSSGWSKVNIEGALSVFDSIIKDPSTLIEKSRVAHERWKQSFTWEQISEAFESLYSDLLGLKRKN